MSEQSTRKPRRKRVPQRYYPAARVLKSVFRWNHIRIMRGHSWKLTFRVRALVKLAGITPSGDQADDYLDALAALHERGQLDAPEVQKHAAALLHNAEQVMTWHEQKEEREEEEARQSVAAPKVTAADYDADPWDELREEFEQFLDEIEPEEEAGEE